MHLCILRRLCFLLAALYNLDLACEETTDNERFDTVISRNIKTGYKYVHPISRRIK